MVAQPTSEDIPNNSLASEASVNRRYLWPQRAVVTAGMPYGNKPLHFGHIGGVFVPADCFARFLRDRIGPDNVLFVSGTDCYGSPIDEGYRRLKESGEFKGSIQEYVEQNHASQKQTLHAFDISLSVYEGSGIGHSGEVHQLISEKIIEKLYENGHLTKRSTLQFYDVEAGIFLNGRQVRGRCPVQGCKSEHAYADECDMGHSYAPEDLIAPKSTVTGTTPQMRPVENWYFDLPHFASFLRSYVEELEADPNIRTLVPQVIKEFLQPPVMYLKNDERGRYEELSAQLPEHELHEAEKGKQSFEIEFKTIEARDSARTLLAEAKIRFRTGKTLVPFRMTGNVVWGIKAPVIEGLKNLTLWCWPESLWAPLSFTMAVNDERGVPRESWRDWWCSEDAAVFQFIGQDNLYFYGIAQSALIEALKPGDISIPGPAAHPIRQTRLIANHHILFGNKKASSSGSVKPPSADELLSYYTVEQLRAHFLALGLDQKAVGFKPKPLLATAEQKADPRVADPVLKEGVLLTNVFNRLARSCFYEAQKNFEGYLPLGKPRTETLQYTNEVLENYDLLMLKVELHSIMSLMDNFIRWSNKYWSEGIRAAELEQDNVKRRQVLVDTFFLLRVATLLMHPVVPRGCEKICDYLNFHFHEFFSWNYDIEDVDELCSAGEINESRHRIRELPPHFDFFQKHPSQVTKRS